MREASEKQLKLIREMEAWLKAFGDGTTEYLTHEDIPTVKEASTWISANMSTFKALTADHSQAELFGKEAL